MSVGMSLVISSGFGFDRIPCIYAGSESRKSTESSSKTSRKGSSSSGGSYGLSFLTLKTIDLISG